MHVPWQHCPLQKPPVPCGQQWYTSVAVSIMHSPKQHDSPQKPVAPYGPVSSEEITQISTSLTVTSSIEGLCKAKSLSAMLRATGQQPGELYVGWSL